MRGIPVFATYSFSRRCLTQSTQLGSKVVVPFSLYGEVLTDKPGLQARLIGTLVDQMCGLAPDATCPSPLEAGNWSAQTCDTPIHSTPTAPGLPHCPERRALFALLAVSLPQPPPWLLGAAALAAAALAAVLVARAVAVFVGWLRRAELLARLPHPRERAWLLGDLAAMVRMTRYPGLAS